jgi:hypothetical protein
MHLVETYLSELNTIRRSGQAVDETSYYTPLDNLLDAVGKTLTPRVRCILTIQNRGAGHPDGGLFTPDQFQRMSGGRVLEGQLPSRGVIEVKPTHEDAWITAEGEQVTRYWGKYRQVLVTNYRDFVLVGEGPDGQPQKLETFRLAANEAEFWRATERPRKAAAALGDRFLEYLRRALLQTASLAAPREVAWFLASYARDTRLRIENVNLPALNAIRGALEQALGIEFQRERGDRFFRSTLVQTLFYGMFSAWVLWHRERPDRTDRFDWRLSAFHLNVPLIQTLFSRVTERPQLRALGIMEPLDWAGSALNRVNREQFFRRFEEEHAVQYFYEPFLEAFDPALRRELGVWYTPPEIVKYMVARVDAVLREELDLPDGLADERVVVLDPCCGTGAYLVEVLRKIHETLDAKGPDALIAHDVKKAATERVIGFELLPAPFVVSHLQLGLLLQSIGVPLVHSTQERARVYLTNALTGWEAPDAATESSLQLRLAAMPELLEERDAARAVKREETILVVLGNPPYNGFAGLAVDEERNLSTKYRHTVRVARPQGQGLNDLYVRFFRMAERRITEMTGRGIVCFISNYSWLDGLSFTGMREHYLSAFDRIWIDSLNGDKYRTGKLTPEGLPDPSVFSTPFNREGIQVGTAVALMALAQRDETSTEVLYREFWGTSKRETLLASLSSGQPEYAHVEPALPLGLAFAPLGVSAEYSSWPRLVDLLPTYFPGVKTSRDDVVVDIDRERFDPVATRVALLNKGFQAPQVRRYAYRPFDYRWIYWEPTTNLLDRERSDYASALAPGALQLTSTQRYRKQAFYQPQVVNALADLNVIEANVAMFPSHIRTREQFLESSSETVRPNLSPDAERYLAVLGAQPDDLFFHAIAILHSTEFAADNRGALRQAWPRLPVPGGPELLTASSAWGRRLAALLEPEAEVSGVTNGEVAPELRHLGLPSRAGGGQLNPDTDLRMTAGWGYIQGDRVVMPSSGRSVVRPIKTGRLQDGQMSSSKRSAVLGEETLDVYWNSECYWSNVPSQVWTYHLGGYQVLKKWLSYREFDVLGRSLRPDEIRHFRDIVRRIAAILLMGPDLDANYRAVKATALTWDPAAGFSAELQSPDLAR